MMRTTVTTPTIGSTTSCLTHTNAPTTTAFIVVVSTAPIIVPLGTFTARLTDISRNTTIIQGLALTTSASAIGVFNSVAGWGSLTSLPADPLPSNAAV